MINNKELRRKIVEKSCSCKLGHCGSALSCVDFIDYLYDNILNEKDVFILSKGHGAMALYAVLEKHGKEMEWTMHPSLNEEKGIYATTGSLGHGLPIAVGRAFAKKVKQDGGKVYVLIGDGEMAEGSIWEALLIAKNLNTDNLIIFVDFNKYGASYPVKRTLNLDDNSIKAKLEAFGFTTTVIDGHEEEELSKIKQLGPGLNAVILDTIKGKGIDFLEESHAHGFNFAYEPEKYKETIERLK
jgi:transketolase